MSELFSDLPRGWARSRVDRVASVNARIGWKALTASEYVPDGYVFLATPNIKSRAIDFDNVNYISEFRYKESPELALRVGDVLLVKDGNTLGITNVVTQLPRAATVNGSVAVLRPAGIDPAFMRYVLAGGAIQGLIAAVKDGMGVPHLFQSNIRRLPIPLPPPRVQRAIADYLDRETAQIDALIVKKQRLGDRVYERFAALRMARVLGHMAGTRLQSTGIPWIGMIPESWRVMRLKDLAKMESGHTPNRLKPEYWVNCDIPWVTLNDLSALEWELKINDPKNLINALGIANSSARILPPNTVILSRDATVGRTALLGRP
ncbi:MAG: restriction endonuclease subunit S, partial [Fimbriimonadales bacterium]